MSVGKAVLVTTLSSRLQAFEEEHFALPGISSPTRRAIFVRQLIDSVRRVEYIHAISSRPVGPNRTDGLSPMFDPLRAAIHFQRQDDIDEACWLVFLFVHFGKHLRSGYRYAGDVYSALGTRAPWTFAAIRNNVADFKKWLYDPPSVIQRGRGRGFGNHRKYVSLSAYKPNGTGDAVESYLDWVPEKGGHAKLFGAAMEAANDDPEAAFEELYRSMSNVHSFGRIGKFDYLTMIGKLGLAQIWPGHAYLAGSTGPIKGAKLMLQGHTNAGLGVPEIEDRVKTLGNFLGVGMQEMEDSLCNWQKNPTAYQLFRG